MEEMLKRNLSLGGEQSGHIIFSDYLFTGDGLCTALNVLRTVALTGRTLADLAADLTTYPQVLLNVRVREKVDLQTVPAVADAIARVEARVAGQGRLLVRYSGTEPLLRVMLEGQEQDEIRGWAQEIVDVVKEHLVERRSWFVIAFDVRGRTRPSNAERRTSNAERTERRTSNVERR